MDTPRRDPIDAVLGDVDGHDDLLEVAVVVHGLRAEFLDAEPLVRSAPLREFTDPAPAERVGAVAVRRGLKATGLGVVGKVILGSTLAAASVGGLDATGFVDLPLGPHRGVTHVAVPADVPSTTVPRSSGLASGVGTVVTVPPPPRPAAESRWTPRADVPDVTAAPTSPAPAPAPADNPDLVPVDARGDRGRDVAAAAPGRGRRVTPPAHDTARDLERADSRSDPHGPRHDRGRRDDARPGQHGRERASERSGGRSRHTGGHEQRSVEADESSRAGARSGHDS